MTSKAELRRLKHKAASKAWYAANKAKRREYYSTPEHKAKMREYMREYRSTPEYKAKKREYNAARSKKKAKQIMDEEIKRIQWGVYQV